MEENIAVIILNYRNYELSGECVNNLIELGIKSKIVIVDNNSDNNSYEHLSEQFKNNENVDVIKSPINKGYSAGNNFGIRHIIKSYEKVKYIAIMNPDVVLTYKEMLVNLAERLEENDKLALVSGVMIWSGGAINPYNVYWNIPTDKELLLQHSNLTGLKFYISNTARIPLKSDNSGLAKAEVVPGTFFMIKRSVLEEIGMLDEKTFLYNEENILAIDLKNRGYYEAISINDFYLHNHNPSVTMKSLKQWYAVEKVRYESRQYLCSKYKNRVILSKLLAVIQFLNYIERTIRYVGSRLKWKLKSK